MVVRPARSTVPPVSEAPPGNSASGSGVKRCSGCARASRETKETVHNGLQLLRVRYGLPYSELPDCDPTDLGRFHLFLLGQHKERMSVPFPRRQRPGENGLCSLQRLRRHERWELALSVASIKRNLPAGCSRCTPSMQSQWLGNACSQPPPPSSEYLAHVRRVAARVFRAGWDRRYHSFVGSHCPNPTARAPPRSRADQLWAGRRGDFLTLTTSETDLVPLFEARYKEVQSAGKRRPLVIFDEKVDLLAPLHKLMYSHLRGCDWLLCGPPTEKKMASVCVNAIQTSVDLVAATDGLHHAVAETLLDVAFFSSLKIPRSIRALAKASLTPVFRDGSGVHRRVRHGQMMGAYLSFPLLCLQSYCAATWAARFDEGARFLVNGDDTVISAARAVTVTDYPPGFRLNSDKTTRASNVVEVNSTVFLRRGGRWRLVKHLRRGGALTDYAGMLHMAEACGADPRWQDAFTRSRIGRRWGFLPSQLGHSSYASWCRERQLLRRRHYTDLPVCPAHRDEEGLRRIVGRDPTPVETEALRSFIWENGRKGGLKRDRWNPSVGSIRRTYRYKAQPCRYSLSFVGWRFRCTRTAVTGRWFLVPDEFLTDEEERGLLMLDHWRQAFDSLVQE
jgi:hypothetical protein